MRKLLIAIGLFLLVAIAFLYFYADRPAHNISFTQLKSLKKGMAYKEVTNTLGIPDQVRPFAVVVHDMKTSFHHTDCVFNPSERTDIEKTINSVYNDSIPCCVSAKEYWTKKSTSFIYENKNGIFHHLKIHVWFAADGTLLNFLFSDKGFFSKINNGLVYSLESGKQYWDKGITPIYTDEEIEKLIQKL